jgi:hypothetical protein
MYDTRMVQRIMWLALAIAVSCFNSSALASNEITGEVTKVDAPNKTIVIASECECGSGKILQTSYILGDKTRVTLNGKDAKLADLKIGDDVKVEFEFEDDVQKVVAKREQ